MVTSATMAIRCDETLGLRNKPKRAMFCSVVAGKKLGFFYHQKSHRCALRHGGWLISDYLAGRKTFHNKKNNISPTMFPMLKNS
jgi:hypothetical protein